jgi:galactokinase
METENHIDIKSRETVTDTKADVKRCFIDRFAATPMVIFAPGRVNLIGEHTDYNNGFVLPVAINKGVYFALAKSDRDTSEIYSIKYNETLSVDHAQTGKMDGQVWQNYLLGVLSRLESLGFNIGSFNCVFGGDLPVGAGLSSSAALECGFVTALNELFHLDLSRLQMIHIAQWAEHNYAGVRCGIMDQYASIMGRHNAAVLLDCLNLASEYYPLPLDGFRILLLDTSVKHSLASSEYNTRRKECEIGVAIIQKKYPHAMSLRDVTSAMLQELKSELPDVIYRRCRFVVEENQRVLDSCAALKEGSLITLGQKMFASHDGLSRLYEVSCEELDFLAYFARGFDEVIGSRMMGGGFGGCTINIVRDSFVDEFVTTSADAYRMKFGRDLMPYIVGSSSGAGVI